MSSYLNIYSNLLQFIETHNFKSKFKSGKKTEIKDFSNKSRKNFIYFINSIRIDEFKFNYFLTLTYHNDWPLDFKNLKLDLKKFLIYSRREFKPFEYLWKLELQKRKAPHFHLTFHFKEILTPNEQKFFHEKINSIWNEITSCKCQYCRRYKTRVYIITNQFVFYSYISKEISKEKQTQPVKLGRFWGHSKGLKPFKWATEEITREEWESIKSKLLDNPKFSKRLKQYLDKLPDHVDPKNFFIPSDTSLKIFFEVFEKRFSNLNNQETNK